MKKTLTLLSSLFFAGSFAQCNFASMATLSGDTLFCAGGNNFKTVVAFNPVANLYYSINAGGGTPNEYYDLNGTYLGSSVSADFRGLWYNSTADAMEGNCWDGYFIIDSLTPDGYFGGNIGYPFGTSPVTSVPDPQCAGVLDYNTNTILYYANGTLYGQSRSTMAVVSSVALTGVSLSGVLKASLIYTGCSGKEIGLYDDINRKIYLFSKSNGAYVQSIDMPAGTPGSPSPALNYGIGFANNIFWLFVPGNKWVGYTIFDSSTGIKKTGEEDVLNVYPNPATSILSVETERPGNYVIRDALGNTVQSGRIDQKKHFIDIQRLNEGIYIIKINGAHQKFIKQ